MRLQLTEHLVAARALAALALIASVACADGRAGPSEGGPVDLAVATVATGLSNPVFLTSPTADPRLFVVEQRGTIRIVRDGAPLPEFFLDIRSRVSAGGERGLLGLAFSPNYAETGTFWVYYTEGTGDIAVERYRVGATPDRADAGSALRVLTIPHREYGNHNGGMLQFAPDGKLLIGTGDGGGSGDILGNSQNRASLLGKLLRLDVTATEPYVIPQDNPFVGEAGARAEIWAYGLRNPWRFDADGESGTIFIADVGQNQWEEINAVALNRAGLNFGWPRMEGTHCFGSPVCSGNGLEPPVLEYDHGNGCSITGGFVYHGSAIPSLRGHYFYSDYCTGFLRSFRLQGGAVTDRRDWSVGSLGNVTSFGRDAAGELYIVSSNGTIRRIVPR